MLLFLTQKCHLNEQGAGKELHVNLNKCCVYQQLKSDEHNTNINMAMPQFDERWNIVYDPSRHLEYRYWNTFLFICSDNNHHLYHLYCHFSVYNLIHALLMM